MSPQFAQFWIKKALLHGIMHRVPAELGIPVEDVEITIFETPMSNWGIRGKTGDELVLGYRVGSEN